MATLFLRPLRPRPTLVVGLSAALLLSSLSPFQFRSRPLLCEASPSPSRSISSQTSEAFRTYGEEARTPIWKDGRLNKRVFGEVSLGSVAGVVGGLAVSTFSKSLAFLIGAAVFGIQWLESRGIHVIPRTRIQRYFSNISVRSAVEDNVAFKLSFGATFMLAAFGEF